MKGFSRAKRLTIDAVLSEEPSSTMNQAFGSTVCRITDTITCSISASSFFAAVSKMYWLFIVGTHGEGFARNFLDYVSAQLPTTRDFCGLRPRLGLRTYPGIFG